MALNIKNPEVERLVDEVVDLTGETKTEAVRQALLERKRRLGFRLARTDRKRRLREFLEREVWPQIPADQLGRAPTKEEIEDILGFGPEGY
ncbi:MAG TPA: type II toxin-antitoxin system VapB family antitoxin [Gemmatimonadota bacterium]|nr:type II toxin-antitoxin system VapB family antitoxin [Gemmatimonadota bacterium]